MSGTAPAARKRGPRAPRQQCAGGGYHWWAYYGFVGSSSPTCVRCEAPNPNYDPDRDPFLERNREQVPL